MEAYDAVRDLFDALYDTDGPAARDRLLRAHLAAVTALLSGTERLRRRESPPVPVDRGDRDAHHVAGWELYLLSRISDHLLALGCPAGRPPAGPETGGRVTDPAALDVRTRFLDAAGLEPCRPGPAFSPFHDEIFAVTPDEDLDTVVVQEELWPGFRFGDLVFARRGVHVRAPAHLVDPVVATSSPLYWAYTRDPRRGEDLSHGWGSNSQWRTAPPLFYDDADGLHLNWEDRTTYLTAAGIADEVRTPELPLDRRRELLVHRCVVRPPLLLDPDWPYWDRLSLRRSTWPIDEADVLPDPLG